jgi:hypothetical protein
MTAPNATFAVTPTDYFYDGKRLLLFATGAFDAETSLYVDQSNGGIACSFAVDYSAIQGAVSGLHSSSAPTYVSIGSQLGYLNPKYVAGTGPADGTIELFASAGTEWTNGGALTGIGADSFLIMAVFKAV